MESTVRICSLERACHTGFSLVNVTCLLLEVASYQQFYDSAVCSFIAKSYHNVMTKCINFLHS